MDAEVKEILPYFSSSNQIRIRVIGINVYNSISLAQDTPPGIHIKLRSIHAYLEHNNVQLVL